jgi:hypothetical protein
MQADVRALRRGGRRLPRDEIMAMTPRRGELIIFKRADPWGREAVPVAALVATDRLTSQLAPLDQVRIARSRGSDLVLVGLAEKVGRRTSEYELQSWWVKLVIPESASQPNIAPSAP